MRPLRGGFSVAGVGHHLTPPIETLEARRLLVAQPAGPVGGVIDVDTEWLDTTAIYTQVDDLSIVNGATLIIGPGVTLRSDSTGHAFVVDGGSLSADDADLDAFFTFKNTANIDIRASLLTGSLDIRGGKTFPDGTPNPATFAMAGNELDLPLIRLHPERVPDVVRPNTLIGLDEVKLYPETIHVDTAFPALPGPATYDVAYDFVYVDSGTLTFEPGVNAVRSISPGDLFFSIGSNATFLADEVLIDGRIWIQPGTTGHLLNSEIRREMLLQQSDPAAFVIAGTTFQSRPRVNANYVTDLANHNTLSTPSLLIDSGTIRQDVTWPRLGTGQSTYAFYGTVSVTNGATLSIAPGNYLVEARHTASLQIGTPQTPGQIEARQVTFDASLVLNERGGGVLLNNAFNKQATFKTAPDVALTIEANSFQIAPSVSPEAPARLLGTDQGNSLPGIGVLSGVIDQSVTWPRFDTFDTYWVGGHISVLGEAKLTIEPGIIVEDGRDYRIYIGTNNFDYLTETNGAIVADGVDFRLDVHLHPNASGSITNSTFGKTIYLELDGDDLFTFDANTIGSKAVVSPGSAQHLPGNVFTSDEPIYLDRDTFNRPVTDTVTLPALPDGRAYEFVSGMPVYSGGHVIVEDGVVVKNDSFFIAYGGQITATGVTFIDTFVNLVDGGFGSITDSRFVGFPSNLSIAFAASAPGDFTFTGNFLEVAGVDLGGDPADTFDLRGNNWNTVNLNEIERRIRHYIDDRSRPLALFDPPAARTPTSGPGLTRSELRRTPDAVVNFDFANLDPASVEASDLVARNLSSNRTLSTGDFELTIVPDGAGHRLSFAYVGDGLLPIGWYRFTIPAGSVTGAAGNPLLSDATFTARFLPGDANLDGKVDLADFVILRGNFSTANRLFYEADFNGDGRVDLEDFVLLRNHFGIDLGNQPPAS